MTKYVYKDPIAEKFVQILQEALSPEERVNYVKQEYKDKLSTAHDTHAQHKDSDAIVQHFADNADPTKKKALTSWVVGQYAKGNTRQEDTDRLHNTLSNFTKHRDKLPAKKIEQYDSIKDLETALKPHVGSLTNAEKRQQEEHEGQELKYEDPHIKIYHLKTKEASQHLYGGGVEAGKTNWCTAAKSNNCKFDDYNKTGKLHVVHDKDTGKVYQYHAHEAQFMDAEDHPISHEDYKKLAPSLHKAWDEHPDLTT